MKQVVAIDDVVCLIIFSMVVAFINTTSSGNFSFIAVFLPIIYNIVVLIIGFLSGILLSKLLTPKRSSDNRLILVISLLLGISGLCSLLDISPLLACMVFGATYINTTNDMKLYNQINNFTPPILSMFFILSGMNLDIGALTSLGIVGIAYFLIRIIGKFAGSYIGGVVTSASDEVGKYLGLGLIPQAGVAIGLAFLGQRTLPPEVGDRLLTIILASSVLYELIGPLSGKLALIYSGSIEKHELETPKKMGKAELKEKKSVRKSKVQESHGEAF